MITKIIEPHNPDWIIEFDDIRRIIQSELNDLQIDIQHVGSTAIAGLFAKPILDIDIIIADRNLLSEVTSRLEKIGYVSRGEQEIKGRFVFRQMSDSTPLTFSKNKWQAHHLYVCYADSIALKNHLLFKDALLNNNKLAEQYSHLKKLLTTGADFSKELYTKQKTEFIVSVLLKCGLSKAELIEIQDANA